MYDRLKQAMVELFGGHSMFALGLKEGFTKASQGLNEVTGVRVCFVCYEGDWWSREETGGVNWWYGEETGDMGRRLCHNYFHTRTKPFLLPPLHQTDDVILYHILLVQWISLSMH